MAAETRAKLLSAASELFADTDSRGVSLRAIARAAGVNSALIHYHFGSRDGLFDAAIAQALAPIQDRRRKLMQELRAADWIEARDLARLVVEPLSPSKPRTEKEHGRTENANAKDLSALVELRLLARATAQHEERVDALTAYHFGDLLYGLSDLLGRALPEIPRETKQQRLRMALRLAIDRVAGAAASCASVQELQITALPLKNELVAFIAGGLEAEAS